jgi:transglutaminase-like putative cysteine protease
MTTPAHLRLALAGAIATLLAALTLRPLFADHGWVAPVLTVTAVTVLTGIALRQVTALWPVVALAQVAVLTLTITALFARQEAVWGLIPSPSSIARLRGLLVEGSATVGDSAPPVPVGPGIVLLATVGIAVIAFTVDLIAASLERPAVAGLPLLAVYCVPAAVLPQGVRWPYFLLAAVGFLGLVAVDWVDRIRAWGRILGSGPEGGRAALGGPLGGPLGGGRRIAAVSLAVAVLLPLITPGVGEHLLTNGAGDGEGRGRGTISVVNPILTLRRNLSSRSNTPVITYTTTMSDPEPLRIATDDTFNGERWAPSTGPISRKQKVQQGLPAAPGLGREVATQPHQTKISIGELSETYLPLPYPTTSVEIAGNWLYESASLNVVGDHQSTERTSYTAYHLLVEPTPEQLTAAPAAPANVLATFTRLPAQLDPRVHRIAAQVAGTGTDYERTLRLQDFLRASGGFRYDQEAAGTGTDDSGTDAVLAFLVKKRGYCVQFASTMAVMARTLGIPSRVAVGFLPGAKTKAGPYTITLQDAHAWPEVYFEGAGWVRFEPTPASRVPALPGYARAGGNEEAPAQATPGASATSTASAQAGPGAPRRAAPEEASTPAADTTPFWRSVPWRLLGALGGLALFSAAPAIAAAASRRRRWRTAHSPQEVAAAGWDDLRERLGDLGVAWARSWTPRAVLNRLSKDHDLDGVQREALARLTHGVETAWYAPPDDDAARHAAAQDVDQGRRQAHSDSDLVVSAVAAGLDPRRRRRALLFPRSGMAVLTGERRRQRADLAGRSGSITDEPDQTRPQLTVGSGKRRH